MASSTPPPGKRFDDAFVSKRTRSRRTVFVSSAERAVKASTTSREDGRRSRPTTSRPPPRRERGRDSSDSRAADESRESRGASSSKPRGREGTESSRRCTGRRGSGDVEATLGDAGAGEARRWAGCTASSRESTPAACRPRLSDAGVRSPDARAATRMGLTPVRTSSSSDTMPLRAKTAGSTASLRSSESDACGGEGRRRRSLLGIQPRHDTNPVSDEAIERDERRAPSRAVTHHGNDVHRRPSPERADLDPEGHATSPALARRATGRPPVRPKWRAVRPADRRSQFRARRVSSR